jgi:hypothetical protein
MHSLSPQLEHAIQNIAVFLHFYKYYIIQIHTTDPWTDNINKMPANVLQWFEQA